MSHGSAITAPLEAACHGDSRAESRLMAAICRNLETRTWPHARVAQPAEKLNR